jgi:uncharacterized membrane protein (DUF373 family)
MRDAGAITNAIARVEAVAITVLKILLMLAVAVAIVVLYVLFFSGLFAHVTSFDSMTDLQGALQRVFAGVLLVLLGLELIETLKAYSAEHRVRIEVVLIVAMIALGRHIVQMDFEHLSWPILASVSGLMTALAISYFLVRRAHLEPLHDQKDRR